MSTILVLTTTYPRWADDTEPAFVHQLCAELAGSHRVHVLAPHCAGAKRSEVMDGVVVTRFRYLPVSWQRLSYDGGILPKLRTRPWLVCQVPLLLLAMAGAAMLLCRRHRPRVIHAHWILPQGLIALWLRQTVARTAKVLVTSHGSDLYALRGGICIRLKRLVLRRADGVVVVSRAMREFCQARLGIERAIEVCSMGIDCRRVFTEHTPAEQRKGFLFVGRLVEKKGVDTLLRAFAGLEQADEQEDMLTLVGDGPQRRRLQQLAAELGVSDRVHFIGAVGRQEAARYYNQAAICVVPSLIAGSGDQEGLGLVAAEALACGCITIVSDLPALQDVHDNPALQFPAGDAERLRERLHHACRHRREAAAQCQVMRRRVIQHFDWPVVGEHYARILQRLTGSTNSTG